MHVLPLSLPALRCLYSWLPDPLLLPSALGAAAAAPGLLDRARGPARTRNPGTRDSPPVLPMPGRHPTFKNHPDNSTVWYRGIKLPSENGGKKGGFSGENRKVKKSSGEKFVTFFAGKGGPPWGLMGVKIFFQKSYGIYPLVAITKALAPAVATPVGRTKKGIIENSTNEG